MYPEGCSVTELQPTFVFDSTNLFKLTLNSLRPSPKWQSFCLSLWSSWGDTPGPPCPVQSIFFYCFHPRHSSGRGLVWFCALPKFHSQTGPDSGCILEERVLQWGVGSYAGRKGTLYLSPAKPQTRWPIGPGMWPTSHWLRS